MAADYSSAQPAAQASVEGTVVGAPPEAALQPPSPATTSSSVADARHTLVLGIVALVALLSIWHTRTLDESRLRPRTDALAAPPLLFMAAAFAAWSAWQIGGSVAAGNPGAAPGPATRDGALVILSAYGVGFFAVVSLLLLAPPLRSVIGLRPRWRDLLVAPAALAIALPLVLLTTLLGRALAAWLASRQGLPTPDSLAHQALRELFAPDAAHGLWWWVSVALIALAAPAFEEFVYRAFLQTSFIRAARAILPARATPARFGPVWLGIVATSVIFALAHVGAAPWYAMPGLFLFGVALGVAYERTGRIGVPILMHAGFNTINLFLAAMITP